jgi:hypothetical protein
MTPLEELELPEGIYNFLKFGKNGWYARNHPIPEFDAINFIEQLEEEGYYNLINRTAVGSRLGKKTMILLIEKLNNYHKQKNSVFDKNKFMFRPIKIKNIKYKPPQEGYIYFIESINRYTKIGRSKNIGERLNGLISASPFKLYLKGYILSKDMVNDESYLHHKFKENRTNGEWFNVKYETIKTKVTELLILDYL